MKPEIEALVGDYCYRANRPYPTDEKSLNETLDLMLSMGYITKNERDKAV